MVDVNLRDHKHLRIVSTGYYPQDTIQPYVSLSPSFKTRRSIHSKQTFNLSLSSVPEEPLSAVECQFVNNLC